MGFWSNSWADAITFSDPFLEAYEKRLQKLIDNSQSDTTPLQDVNPLSFNKGKEPKDARLFVNHSPIHRKIILEKFIKNAKSNIYIQWDKIDGSLFDKKVTDLLYQVAKKGNKDVRLVFKNKPDKNAPNNSPEKYCQTVLAPYIVYNPTVSKNFFTVDEKMFYKKLPHKGLCSLNCPSVTKKLNSLINQNAPAFVAKQPPSFATQSPQNSHIRE